jgi:hypothetical protein
VGEASGAHMDIVPIHRQYPLVRPKHHRYFASDNKFLQRRMDSIHEIQ